MSDDHTEIAKSASRRAWLSAGGPIFALVVLVSLFAVLLQVDFARQQDRAFAEGSQRLVGNAVLGRASALAAVLNDYAAWDEAYAHVTRRFDPVWLEGNYYSSFVDLFLVVRRGEAQPRYIWRGPNAPHMVAPAQAEILEAVARMPLRPVDGPATASTVTRTTLVLNGMAVLITAAPITPEDLEARRAQRLQGAPRDFAVAVQFLDGAKLDELGRRLALRNLVVSATPAQGTDWVSLPLHDVRDHTVGYLQWSHDRPGAAAFAHRVWIVLLGLLIAGVLTVIVARKLVAWHVSMTVRGEAALESSRLKSEFISTMSHELRTPLNAIIGYAELIEEEAPALGASGDGVRRDANRILTAGRRLNRLINDVLDQSRIDAGRMQLHRDTLDVHNLLEEVEEILEPAALARGLAFTAAASPDMALAVADHARLRQCLVNLVTNAINVTKQGEVRISARTDMIDGRAFILFDVIDRGPGIPRAELDNVFSPFAHFESEDGGGLSLSISRKLARAMGGDIHVASETGKGSVFTLRVPAARVSAVRAA